MTIKPYTVNIPHGDVNELKDRLKNARWPHIIKDSDWQRGVPHDYLKKLVDRWLHTFDWQKQQDWLNEYDQFMANVDGQNIHFFHIKSKEEGALPLMLLHGWPSSGVEFLHMVDTLTDPVKHGGKAEEAFHVIIPTHPGFGLSVPMTEHWDAGRTATAYTHIMQELGYEKWGVHGGDVGSDIAGEINYIAKGLKGVHVSTDMRSIIWYAGFTGNDPAKNPKLSKEEKQHIAELTQNSSEDGGYLEIQKTRPLTIGYLLNDSPIGQLAWIIEKFKFWTGKGDKLPEDSVDIDQILTNVSLYWFSMSGASAADFLCTNLHAQRDWSRQPLAPMGMACFGAIKSAQALQDPEGRMPHWSNFEAGNHFPAMEVPELLVGDLRTFFGSLK